MKDIEGKNETDLVINNTGGRERRGKDNHRDFKPENEQRGLVLLDVGKLGEETSGRNFRADC